MPVHSSSARSPRLSVTRSDLVADLGVATGSVAVTTAVHLVLVGWVDGKASLMLFVATAAALTFWRGLGPGMLATSLGAPVGSVLIEAPWAPVPRGSAVPVEYSLMFASSLFICWLIYRLRVEQETVNAVQDQKDHALAFVSHELRQPLATVHLAAAMLHRDRSEDSVLRATDLISRSAARLSKVVDDLVDVTRLRGAGLRIEPQLMRLQDAMLAAADASAPTIVHRQQTLEVNVPLDPPLWIRGDTVRLEQVFGNLLSNASRYSPEGAEIAMSVGVDNGSAVAFVRDTGVGISGDMLERVFDPFVRESNSPAEGLGIGLALARNLITKHGGTIAAHSDGPGRGSTFVVQLPLASTPAASERSLAAG